MMKSKQKVTQIYIVVLIAFAAVFFLSLMVGKYPLSIEKLMAGEEATVRVFFTLRLPRTLMGIFGGLGLGIAGMIYQTVFHNPLASPDIIGVSAGASAGAAFAIIFLANTPVAVMSLSFVGSLLAILLSLGIASLAKGSGNISIVLSGLAVHALAQTILMVLKTVADPEKELASIEYWIMGSLNAITLEKIPVACIVTIICVMALALLYRQVLLLSVEEGEAKLLGVSVVKMRLVILLLATLIVAAIVSVTGIITFVGLLAPHVARMLTGDNRLRTLWLSGLMGSILLCLADVFARSAAESELPVSVFTSLLGAPFLVFLLLKRRADYV